MARRTRNGTSARNGTSTAAEIEEIHALIGDLEARLTRLNRLAAREGAGAAAAAGTAASHVTDAVIEALTGMADRVRQSAQVVGQEFSGRMRDRAQEMTDRLGDGARQAADEAFRFGGDAFRRIADEAERRPLMTLAIAAGVGYLAGLAGRRV